MDFLARSNPSKQASTPLATPFAPLRRLPRLGLRHNFLGPHHMKPHLRHHRSRHISLVAPPPVVRDRCSEERLVVIEGEGGDGRGRGVGGGPWRDGEGFEG